MGLLSLIIALGSSFVYVVQAIVSVDNFSVINRIINAFIALICIGIFTYQTIKIKYLKKKSILIIYSMISLLILYYYTNIKYGYWNDNYKTQLLMFGVHAIPAIMMGSLIATKNILNKMLKWLQPIMMLYTINITISVLSSDVLNSTKGVQAFNENSLNYQTISYYIVTAFAINIFIISNFDKINQFKIFSNRIWKYINIMMIFIQVFCLLSAGGRGGTILFLFFIIYNIIINRKSMMYTYKRILLTMCTSILIIIVGRVILSIPYISVGLNRLCGFFLGGSNKIRSDYRITYHATEAIKSFSNKPILGHGLGSVFYEFNIYTHNIFTDFLVEGGIVYFLVLILILVLFFYKSFKILKFDYEINIILIIFFSSFIMLLFSGYYFNDTGIWFAIGYIFTYSPKFCDYKFKLDRK